MTNKPLHIAFKFTTRSRPDLFHRGMKSIIDNLSDKENYSILVTCDSDDKTMIDAWKQYPTKKVQFVYGTSFSKIDAINRDLQYLNCEFDILINMSDDMVFVKHGFDEVIRADFENDTDLCLHYPDGYRNDIITMAILGKEYFNRFGYIYHWKYTSLYCDNEMTDVAKMLDAYKFNEALIFKHLHPSNEKDVKLDAQYQFTESFYHIDKDVYENRKSTNFESFKLAVGILTTNDRKNQLDALLSKLEKLELNDTYILIENSDKNIGAKRNYILKEAFDLDCDYVCFIDDDDDIDDDYFNLIFDGLKNYPTHCSLKGIYTVDGKNPVIFEHSIKYSTWKTNDSGKIKYERPPNHLNVIKTSIANKFKFKEINHGEDKDWSEQIFKSGLLNNEYYIEKPIYHYLKTTK
jgi:hypothetical protein